MNLQEQLAESGLVEALVTHTMEVDGQLIIIEQVPALIDPVTGERFFTGETVDRLSETVRQRQLVRMMAAPVYALAA